MIASQTVGGRHSRSDRANCSLPQTYERATYRRRLFCVIDTVCLVWQSITLNPGTGFLSEILQVSSWASLQHFIKFLKMSDWMTEGWIRRGTSILGLPDVEYTAKTRLFRSLKAKRNNCQTKYWWVLSESIRILLFTFSFGQVFVYVNRGSGTLQL